MRRFSDEAKVGIIVLISLILLIFLLFNSASFRISRGGQKVKVHFQNVSELTMKAPVHLSGVKIGEVTKIELLEDKVEVSLELMGKIPLRRGAKVTIGTLGLVGETYVDVKNGPLGSPKLLPNEMIKGVEPVNPTDMMAKIDRFVAVSTETLSSAEELLKSNRSEIQSTLSELKVAISDLSQEAQRSLADAKRLIADLSQVIKDNDKMLNRTMNKLNLILDRADLDSEEISYRLKGILTDLNDFVRKDINKINPILDRLSEVSNSLYSLSNKLDSDLGSLNHTTSDLLNSLGQLIQSESPKLQQGLSNFSFSSKSLEELIGSLRRIVAKVEDREGSIGRLLNDKSLAENVEQTLTQAQHTMEDIEKLSEKLNQNLKRFSELSPSIDYELRYRGGQKSQNPDGQDGAKTLHNELGISILPTRSSKLRAGLSSREGQVDYELQAAFNLGRLWAKAGLIRSQAAAGLDYWVIRERLGLSLEAVGITDERPELDFETIFKANSNWNLILGAEDITDKAGFTAGVKATY